MTFPTKTTRLTFVERLANYTTTVHADISQPETYLNVMIITDYYDGLLRQTTLSTLSTPGRAAEQSMTSPGGCPTTKQEEREVHCARSFRESLSVSAPGKHGEAEPGPEQRLSRAATVLKEGKEPGRCQSSRASSCLGIE